MTICHTSLIKSQTYVKTCDHWFHLEEKRQRKHRLDMKSLTYWNFNCKKMIISHLGRRSVVRLDEGVDTTHLAACRQESSGQLPQTQVPW